MASIPMSLDITATDSGKRVSDPVQAEFSATGAVQQLPAPVLGKSSIVLTKTNGCGYCYTIANITHDECKRLKSFTLRINNIAIKNYITDNYGKEYLRDNIPSTVTVTIDDLIRAQALFDNDSGGGAALEYDFDFNTRTYIYEEGVKGSGWYLKEKIVYDEDYRAYTRILLESEPEQPYYETRETVTMTDLDSLISGYEYAAPCLHFLSSTVLAKYVLTRIPSGESFSFRYPSDELANALFVISTGSSFAVMQDSYFTLNVYSKDDPLHPDYPPPNMKDFKFEIFNTHTANGKEYLKIGERVSMQFGGDGIVGNIFLLPTYAISSVSPYLIISKDPTLNIAGLGIGSISTGENVYAKATKDATVYFKVAAVGRNGRKSSPVTIRMQSSYFD